MEPKIIEIIFDTIDSTQSYAKTSLETFSKDSFWRVISADCQTKGLGQKSRHWSSPPNNIYVSFVFPFPNSQLIKLLYVTQVTTITVCQILEENLNLKPEIKWKNDVMINDKKICGVLAEAETMGDFTHVIDGIGINVNTSKEECEKLDQPTTSLSIETGGIVDKKMIYESLKRKLYENINKLINEGFEGFLEYIKGHAAFVGRDVRIISDKDGSVNEGKFMGLDDYGFMMLMQENKKIVSLCEGKMNAL